MGRRGPAPKPSRLKLVQGTYRPDRAAHNEPEPPPAVPSPPSILGREGRREWRRVTKHLAALGLISELDRGVLFRYCHAYEEAWKMQKDIDKNGEWQVAESGYESQRPAVSIRNQALGRMARAEAELGLTPSARTRISAPEKPSSSSNPFLQALGG